MISWILGITEAFTVFVVFFFWWSISYALLKSLFDSMLNRLISIKAPTSEDIETKPFWKRLRTFATLYPVGVGIITFVFYLWYFLS